MRDITVRAGRELGRVQASGEGGKQLHKSLDIGGLRRGERLRTAFSVSRRRGGVIGMLPSRNRMECAALQIYGSGAGASVRLKNSGEWPL